jgi:magnesium chelatase subunit I
VERPKDPRIVKDIISIGFKNGKRQSYVKREYPFYKEIKEMCNIYREIAIPDEILKILASIYVDFNIESIRGIESLLTGAKLYSALNKRKTVTFEDIYFSAPLALRHRVDINTLTNVMKFLDKLLKETNMFDKTNENQAEHSNKFLNLDSNQKQKRNKEKKNNEEKRSSPTYPNKSRLISFLQTIKKACELLLKAVTDKRRSKTSINKNKTSNTTGSSSIADPSKIDIESPYKKAMPIKSIDVSNIVKTEEDLNELSRTIRLSRKLN